MRYFWLLVSTRAVLVVASLVHFALAALVVSVVSVHVFVVRAVLAFHHERR